MARSWLPRNRLVRALVYFGFAMATFEVLYVIVANVALAASAKRFDGGAPVGVAFERAYSWIPGRAHLHGVRVHGAASGGWAVAIADADVAFAPWRVVTAPRLIDAMTADVTSVDIGARRSKGAMHVVVTDLAIDDASISFHMDTRVDDATLESGGVLVASGVHGTIALDVAAVTSGKIALDGVFLSLEPLASFGSLRATQDPGTLHVAGTLDKGTIAPASEIRAHTAHATLKDAHGASADFPRGLDVVVRIAPVVGSAEGGTARSAIKASELQLAVETPSLVFGSADPARPADAFDDFEMTVPAGSSDLKLDRLEMRSLAWTSKHATVHEGATTLSAAADGQLHFETRSDGALVADSGFMHATNVTVENPDAPDRAPFEARLVLTRLSVTRAAGIGIHGPLHASGDDARPLMEVLVTSDSIRRTIGPALANKPFTLDATLDRDSAHVTFDDFVLKASSLELRGGYRRRDATSHGAFILEGGPLPVGIAMHGNTESVVVGASASWLARELAKTE